MTCYIHRSIYLSSKKLLFAADSDYHKGPPQATVQTIGDIRMFSPKWNVYTLCPPPKLRDHFKGMTGKSVRTKHWMTAGNCLLDITGQLHI